MRPDFLTGAIDLHVHSRPDVIPRLGTSIDIARAAARARMRAIVLKDHLFPSFLKAEVTQQAVPDIRVFGGITLNASVGGLNVQAVKGALMGGAKVVMFPTWDSQLYFKKPDKSRIQLQHSLGEAPKLVQVVGEDGKLFLEAERILGLLAEHPDVILSSGHLGPEEALPVVARARECGIRRIVIEHPNAGRHFSEEDLLRLVSAGAILNISYNAYNPAVGKRDPKEAVEMIRTVGAEHCTLITDGGQPYSPMPAETMRVFSEILYHLGLTLEQIFTMTKINPALLLGLPETAV